MFDALCASGYIVWNPFRGMGVHCCNIQVRRRGKMLGETRTWGGASTSAFKAALLVLSIVVLLQPRMLFADTYVFKTVDDPLGTNGTQLNGIEGNVVVGNYNDSSGQHGFSYDGSTFRTIDAPGASGTTVAWGISNGLIVGDYVDSSSQGHGFIYDGTNFTTLNVPLAGPDGTTGATGTDGTTIVGNYYTAAGGFYQDHGFIYDGSSYTTLDNPLAVNGTQLSGVSGTKILGLYLDAARLPHGFIYNGSSFTYLNDPLGVKGTAAPAIYGSEIAGTYFDSGGLPHGYVFDGSNYVTVDNPLGIDGTNISGIFGNTVVGSYYNASGAHGFVATLAVPLPSSANLGMVAMSLLLMGRVLPRRCLPNKVY
jgi:hypothetical protein